MRKFYFVFFIASLFGSAAFGGKPVCDGENFAALVAKPWSVARKSALAKIIKESAHLDSQETKTLIAEAENNPEQLILVENPNYRPSGSYQPHLADYVLYQGNIYREGWWRRRVARGFKRQEIYDSEPALYWDNKAKAFVELPANKKLLGRFGKITLYRGTDSNEAIFIDTLKAIKQGQEPNPERLISNLNGMHHIFSGFSRDKPKAVRLKFPLLADLDLQRVSWPSLMANEEMRRQLIREALEWHAGYDGFTEKTYPLFFSPSKDWAKEFGTGGDGVKKVVLRFDLDLSKIPPNYAGIESSGGSDKFSFKYPHNAHFEIAYDQSRLSELLDGIETPPEIANQKPIFPKESWSQKTETAKPAQEEANVFFDDSVGTHPLDLHAWLADPNTDGKGIIERLEQDDEIRKLYAKSSGVWEGYSVKQHTLMAYDLFKEQLPKFKLDSIYYPEVYLPHFLKFAVAVHDVGKGLAVEAGSKALQHEYTIPLVEKIMKRIGFSAKEIIVAKTIIGNDVLGDLMKGTISVDEAFKQLSDLAKIVNMSPGDYFRVQSFFYTIDAGSYPSLKTRLFEVKNGKLVPRKPEFQALTRMFENQGR